MRAWRGIHVAGYVRLSGASFGVTVSLNSANTVTVLGLGLALWLLQPSIDAVHSLLELRAVEGDGFDEHIPTIGVPFEMIDELG